MAGMMTSLLLLLLAGVTVGRVVDLQKRIIGGKTCDATERQHHVKLISSDGTKTYLCGGTLIDKDWILTAAHCVEPGWTVKAVIGVHPVGKEKPKMSVIKRVDLFTKVGKNGKDQIHDMALLQLEKPVEGLDPVNLPDCTHRPQIGEEVQIAGLAATDVDGLHMPDTLQCANTKVYACANECSLAKVIYFQTFERKFCYQQDGVDARPGDSGGGVMFNKMIYGVQIRSYIEACTGPSTAMDLCGKEYKDWIEGLISRRFP